MKIIVDAMSGDNAPRAQIHGAFDASYECDADIVLVGRTEVINRVIKEDNIDASRFEIIEAPEIISMEDDATSVLKSKRNSSMGKAFDLLAKGYGDAMVSAGNTGAVLSGATLIVKRVKGVKRAALAPIMPSSAGKFVLIDCGANVECKSEYLVQFGKLGSIYAENVLDIKNPRVGLVNNGTEESKGTELYVETNRLLRECDDLNFVGNIEGRDIPLGAADVVVADGFTGNVILKLTEGVGAFFSNYIKDMFKSSFAGKIAAMLVMKKINALKKTMDYKEVGGSPLLGISKPVIKAHGNADERCFKNAIKQAINFAKSDAIKKQIEAFDVKE